MDSDLTIRTVRAATPVVAASRGPRNAVVTRVGLASAILAMTLLLASLPAFAAAPAATGQPGPMPAPEPIATPA